MNISSINNNWLLYSNYLNTASTTATTSTGNSQVSSVSSDLQNTISNADGDTFEFSGNTQNVSQNLTYGPPPPPRGPGGPGSDSAESDDIKSFLDKVADGTVTDEDITEMQSILQEAQESFGVNNGSDPIKTFMDKVADGTVTDEDITEMQSILQQMQQQFLNNFDYGTVSGDSYTE